MKVIFFLFLNLTFVISIYSQKTIRIFSGINITKMNPHGIEDNIDVSKTLPFQYSWIILPSLGLDYNIPLSNKISISTGLGVNLYGCSDYNKHIQLSDIDSLYREFFIKYPNLKIIDLTFPISMKYRILDKLYLYVGYGFNYSVRKNQSSILYDVDFESYNYFSYFHHFLNIGLEAELKKISIKLISLFPLSHTYDSKDKLVSGNRYYGDIYGMQLTIGYIISE
ncbi:MAG: outer membrane beta-barrel protein [Saprospiraceae bacterium]